MLVLRLEFVWLSHTAISAAVLADFFRLNPALSVSNAGLSFITMSSFFYIFCAVRKNIVTILKILYVQEPLNLILNLFKIVLS